MRSEPATNLRFTRHSCASILRMRKLTLLLLLAAAGAAHAQTEARDSGAATLGQRPYMGWSSWSFFRVDPTEAKVKAQVDALIADRLPELGYRYINIDARWTNGYDEHGIPKPNLTRFPSGMAGMAEYLHRRGLRFGLYMTPGISKELYEANPAIEGTTSHIHDIADTSLPGATLNDEYKIDLTKPAARAYIDSVIRQFARWKVDFVKLDFVGPGGGNRPADNRDELRLWHQAILHSGYPIWLELSNWLSIDQARLWRANANGWRIEDDIECYDCDKSTDPTVKGNLTEWSHVALRFADVREWAPYAGPGGWNDLDSLELGNGAKDGVSPDERQSMFIFWAISCAPLYLGSDLTQMDPDDLKLISNRDLIAIDQRGILATPLDIFSLRTRVRQAWINLYPDGEAVLSLFNLGPDPAQVKFDWREVDALRNTEFAKHPPVLTDLMSGEKIAPAAEGIDLTLASHASRIFRLTTAKLPRE